MEVRIVQEFATASLEQCMKIKRLLSILLAIFLTVLFSGCGSQTTVDGFSPLYDRGILPLSEHNPYLGTNLFISQQAEKGTLLKQFLVHRGGPSAIKIKTASVQPEMIMFFPRDKEVYKATLSTMAIEPIYDEWVIKGPMPMSRSDFRDLRTVGVYNPIFVIAGKKRRFGRTMEAPQLRLPYPKPTPKIIVKKIEVPTEGVEEVKPRPTPKPLPDVLPFEIPQNLDQEALARAKGYAPRNEKGDLIHVVEGSQSLVDIVKWYTNSNKDVAMIGARNGIDPKAKTMLPDGTELIIPRNLVTQPKMFKNN